MISIKNLSKTYYLGEIKVEALKNISLEVKEGEFIAITGPSGSGKSTMLHILGLLDKPDSGSYKLDGIEAAGLNERQLAAIRNDEIGFVFQTFNLLPKLNSVENVELPLIYTPHKNHPDFNSPQEMLAKVGLANRSSHTPNELSGGETQRVAIARALIKKPGLVLADEPTGNLDSVTAREIIGVLRNLHEEGKTIVMITHEENLAREANRIIKLLDGKIISDEKIRNDSNPVRSEKKNIGIKQHKFNKDQVKNYFKQAVKSLWSNKTRSLLSITGVLIGVTAVISMLALGAGAREDIKQRLAHLGSNLLTVRPNRHAMRGIAAKSGVAIRLTEEDGEAIKKISLIDKVSPTIDGRVQVVYGSKNKDTTVIGATPDYEDIQSYTPVMGRFYNEKEMVSREKVALLGKAVFDTLFENEYPIGKTIKINRISFKVIGVLPEKGASSWRDRDDRIIIPLNTAMYRLFGKKYVERIEVKVKDEEDIPIVQAELQRLIAKRQNLPDDKKELIEVRNSADIQEAVSSAANTFSWLLGSIAFISLLVGGIGIMNIMLVSVTERTREIGIRKAIGANNKDILSQFIIETVVICIIGGIMGILLGSAIAMALSRFAGWSTKISFFSIALAFIFSALIGLVFGLWPARKASKLNPIDALRYE
ncbi:MAG: ABC transporter permease [Elusimicrobia bacterium]|jgi:macrolide transport system ATP-binding/permease protein|nr:ABC transporter permease [Elusimicrobiota bacterium]